MTASSRSVASGNQRTGPPASTRERWPRVALGERPHQVLEVLPRLDAADEQHVRTGDAEPATDGIDGGIRDRRERLRIDTVMHHVHPRSGDPERLAEILRCRGGRHDDGRRFGERRREPPPPSLIDVRCRLREVLEREIVDDRDDAVRVVGGGRQEVRRHEQVEVDEPLDARDAQPVRRRLEDPRREPRRLLGEVPGAHVGEEPARAQEPARMQVPRDELVVGVRERQVTDQLLGVLAHTGAPRIERRPSIDRDSHP